MRMELLRYGLTTAVLAAGLGMGSAQAMGGAGGAGFLGRAAPVTPVTPVTPVAMCGYTCRSGGRYIPGPPGVCYDEGLRYCGSSRDWDGSRERRRFYQDDDDSEVVIERRRYDPY